MDDDIDTVAQAAFHTTEDTRRYLMLREGLVRQRGSSSATTPPCLHCRQEITAKGVVQWRRTSRPAVPPTAGGRTNERGLLPSSVDARRSFSVSLFCGH